MKLLEQRVAVVTGAAQGIGLAIATTFAQQGVAVVLADLNIEGAQAARAHLEEQGARALALQVDVREPDQVQQMIETAISRWGSLDVLVNNAGITRDATMRKMTLEN